MARAMKDSGIEWIGEIPQEWNTIKFKYVFSIIGGNGFPDSLQGKQSGDFPFCKVSDINGAESNLSCASNYISYKTVLENKFNIIPQKSILMAKIGAALSKNHRKINDIPCCIDNNTQALIPRRNDVIKYLYYLSQCIDMGWFDNKGTVPSVNNQRLLAFDVPNVGREEQSRIASYLDCKCAEIDSVIAETQKTIEEYKKLKQSIITEAVTKGIRKNRPMKDSGIEWIGEIPEEWDKISLKYCTYIRARLGWKGLKADEYVETGYPLLSAFNIINNDLDFSELNFINQERYDESPEIKLNPEDILLVKDGAGIGKCAIVEHLPMPSTVNGSIAVLSVLSSVMPKYLYYFFLSKVFQKIIDRIKDGMGVPHLFQSDLKEIQVVSGNLEEQVEIVNYLEENISKIDEIVETKYQLLSELETYKKSLIYEYVTGKKEVPHAD